MSPGLLHRLLHQARRRALENAAFTAHAEWRSECAAVQAAYRRWVDAGPQEEASACEAYSAALDREEHAAGRHARLISQADQIPETVFSHQRGRVQIS
jgi:hypothetical protein